MFDPKEQEIIQWGIQNGKSKEEVKKALGKYLQTQQRAVAAPIEPPTDPAHAGFLANMKNSLIKRKDAYLAEINNPNQNPIVSGLKGVAQLSGVASDIADQAMKVIPGGSYVQKKIGQGFNKVVQDAANDPNSLANKILHLEQTDPHKAKIVVDFLEGASASGEIASNILLADQEIKLAGSAVKTAGKVAAKVGEPVVKPLVRGVEKAGELTSKAGEKVYDSAFTKTADEARVLQNHQINVDFIKNQLKKAPKGSETYKDLSEQLKLAQEHAPVLRADTALNKGIVGTEKMIGRQAGVEKMSVWKNQVEPALKSSPDKMTKAELFAKAEQRIASEVEPSRKAALQNALDSLKEDYASFDATDLVTANKIKTSLDTFTPTKIFKGQDVASELKTLKADMASAIREKTYESLKDANIKGAYRDYANLKQLEKVGIKALSESGYKGGFGSFWTTAWDAAVTPVKTVGGQVLYKVGNKLQFVGEKGLKTFGEHLEKSGLSNTQGGFINLGEMFGKKGKSVTPERVKLGNEKLLNEMDTNFAEKTNKMLKSKPMNPSGAKMDYKGREPVSKITTVERKELAKEIKSIQSELSKRAGNLADEGAQEADLFISQIKDKLLNKKPITQGEMGAIYDIIQKYYPRKLKFK